MLWWNLKLVPGRLSEFQVGYFGAVPEPEHLGLLDLHTAVLGLNGEDFESVLRSVPRSSINKQDRLGQTALHLAARLGNLSMVKTLLTKGADPHMTDFHGKMPLLSWITEQSLYWSLTLSNREWEAMLDLLGTTQAVNNKDGSDATISHYILYCPTGTIVLLEKLKSLGADFDERSHPGEELIKYAFKANNNNIPVTSWLLENGSSINNRLYNGRTATMAAIKYGNQEALDLLLTQGPDHSLVAYNGRNLLHYAALFGDRKILEVLSRHSLEPLHINAKDCEGWTPLGIARWRRDDNKGWSEWTFLEPDEDPIQWYSDFKALYQQIAESQGQTDIDGDSLEGAWEDTDEESDEESGDHTVVIPGSYHED